MNMKNISTAFVAAQREFAPALKTSTNPHFKSKYAALDACIEAVALNNHGIGLLQKCHQDDSGICVETILLHESGEQLSGGILHVPAAKNDPQGYGSALTYARRYSLMATCGIAPEDNDGNLACRAKPPTFVGDVEVRKLDELLVKTGTVESAFCGWLGVKNLKSLPQSDFEKAESALLKKLNKKLEATDAHTI